MNESTEQETNQTLSHTTISRVRKPLNRLAFLIQKFRRIQPMPTKQGTDELVLIRKVGDKKTLTK